MSGITPKQKNQTTTKKKMAKRTAHKKLLKTKTIKFYIILSDNPQLAQRALFFKEGFTFLLELRKSLTSELFCEQPDLEE